METKETARALIAIKLFGNIGCGRREREGRKATTTCAEGAKEDQGEHEPKRANRTEDHHCSAKVTMDWNVLMKTANCYAGRNEGAVHLHICCSRWI